MKPGCTAPLIRGVCGICLGLIAALSHAADDDLSALLLADSASAAVEQASDWRAYFEGAYGGASPRNGGATRYNHRLSLDAQYDHSFADDWRIMIADRLDMNWPAQVKDENAINTLKEAYLGWRAASDTLLDLGRINVRNGVATGYNPTDYFRVGAVRSVVSISPASLKENRQGSVMVRGQRLWETGSLSIHYSPRLADQASPNAFNPNWGATNNLDRWLVSVSQRLGDSFNPQFLIYGEEHRPTQLGLNLTGLLNDATVVYFEWSGGRSPSLLTRSVKSLGLPHRDDTVFRNSVSSGLTYTTANKISLTAELEYNGRGMDARSWDALRRGPLTLYGLYRNQVQNEQDLPTKQAVFFYGSWQDALINHLDLAAMASFDGIDSSHRAWLEARYHLERVEYALQWQRNSGLRLSNFGATPQNRSWQALLRFYF